MRFSYKILLFLVVFSIIFYWLRLTPLYNSNVIFADLGGVPWLYSSLVTLFSIIAGFVIQKELENWNSLVDAVKGEVDALRELWLWSQHLPLDQKNQFNGAIKNYLEEMAADGLIKSERREISEKVQRAFHTLQEAMFEMSQNDSPLVAKTFSFFTKLIEARTNRMRYTTHHIPSTLRKTVLLGTSLLILLSFFIGIKNIELDYIFTLSVSLMSFIIYLVIDDLDHPLLPGSWHLTSIDYQILLKQITT